MESPSPAALARITANPSIRLCYQFGSSVRGGPVPPRDLDIAVFFGKAIPFDDEMALRSEIGALDPRIDLVILDSAPVVLVREVVTSGRCLLARDTLEQAEFELRAIARYQDFLPFLKTQWDYLTARSEARRGASR